MGSHPNSEFRHSILNNAFDLAVRFAGGFGARDYRQTAAGGNAGGFGGRGGRNQAGHGGTRGFGGGEVVICLVFFPQTEQCVAHFTSGELMERHYKWGDVLYPVNVPQCPTTGCQSHVTLRESHRDGGAVSVRPARAKF